MASNLFSIPFSNIIQRSSRTFLFGWSLIGIKVLHVQLDVKKINTKWIKSRDWISVQVETEEK